MYWLNIDKTHVNLNTIDRFRYEKGELCVWFIGDDTPAKWEDPDKQIYLKLCRDVGVKPVAEG